MKAPLMILYVALVILLMALVGYIRQQVKQWKMKSAEEVDTTPPAWYFPLCHLGVVLGLVGGIWGYILMH